MPKPNNGTNTSFESILLKNKNVSTHPQLASMLATYTAAIAAGYTPPENAIDAILALTSTDPAVQAALANLAQLMQDLGLTLAITSDGGGDSAGIAIDENTSLVTTVVGTDPQNDPVTYSITGGADGALFSINANTGDLSFIAAPDYEAPTDAGADNIYDVTVTATDTVSGQSDSQDIAVTVNDVVEGPPIEIDNAFTLSAGNDAFWGAALNTQVDGLDGNDTIAGDARTIYDGRGPSPVRYMGDDWLNGDAGSDTIYGDAHNITTYRVWYSQPRFDAGDDYIYGGSGGDRLYGDSYYLQTDYHSSGGFSAYGGNDFLSGGTGDDYLVGDSRAVQITGYFGTSTIEGGDDVLNGDDGSDTIIGDFGSTYVNTRSTSLALINNGNDRINGGAGNDAMWGDTTHYRHYTPITVTNGADTFVFNDGSGYDQIRDFQRGLDTIEVDGYGLTDFSQLTITESGGYSTVQFDGSNSVFVIGVTGLDASDFLFT